ncbi:DUF4384 domain-containing protein [candidate division KSB1 bacterium]
MKDNILENILEKWIGYELSSAPEIRPTEKVYAALSSGQSRPLTIFNPGIIRWVSVGTAACIILFAVLLSGPPENQIPVKLRYAEISDEPIREKGKKEEPKGRGRGVPVIFSRLNFQYFEESAGDLKNVDILTGEEDLSLTVKNSYRLLIEPVEERYVYIFQVDSEDRILRIFPNENFSSHNNPLNMSESYHLPDNLNWLYFDKPSERETIYILAFFEMQNNLNELFGRYQSERNNTEKAAILSRILDIFSAVENGQIENAFFTQIEFSIR